ncbi:MAG: TPM domain-containing protein [Caulobacteraceae bacterium]
MLSTLDKERIEAAVTDAETGTTGEIVVVLAAEVSNYREVPLAWGAAAALALPPIALALGLRPMAMAGEAGVWLVAQASAFEAELIFALALYALAQILLFVATSVVVSIPPIRRTLTPAALKRHRVQRAAQHHFAALAARAKAGETGVLIFVGVDDRQVRVLADAALHAKVGESVWTRAAAAVGRAMKRGPDPTAGIVEAVKICGAALKAHFPGDQPHEWPARPQEI